MPIFTRQIKGTFAEHTGTVGNNTTSAHEVTLNTGGHAYLIVAKMWRTNIHRISVAIATTGPSNVNVGVTELHDMGYGGGTVDNIYYNTSADNTDWYGYNATSGGKVKIVFDTGSGSSDWQNTYFSITELTIN